MTYTVKYKAPNGLFWTKIKKVQGDGIVESNAHRFFILDDEVRVEIPLHCSFWFSRERFLVIKQRMEAESGQSMKVK